MAVSGVKGNQATSPWLVQPQPAEGHFNVWDRFKDWTPIQESPIKLFENPVVQKAFDKVASHTSPSQTSDDMQDSIDASFENYARQHYFECIKRDTSPIVPQKRPENILTPLFELMLEDSAIPSDTEPETNDSPHLESGHTIAASDTQASDHILAQPKLCAIVASCGPKKRRVDTPDPSPPVSSQSSSVSTVF